MTISLPAQGPALPPDAIAILTRLDENHVEHVLIGELAANVYGCAWTDDTVVVVPARFERNLDRLSRTLRQLHAQWRVGAGAGPPTADLNPSRLRQFGRMTLCTEHGDLELDFEPPATAGHLDLFEGARRVALAPHLEVEVAAPEDLVRIAEMRGAPADDAALPALRALLGSRTPVGG